MEAHDKIIKDSAKRILGPHGMIQRGSTRKWLDDNGWFFTLIEFQPSHLEKGCFFNVGLHFLWNMSDYFIFSFYEDSTNRINENGRDVFLAYENDGQFMEKMDCYVEKVLEKALHYRNYRRLGFAKERVLPKSWTVGIESHLFDKLMLCLLTDDEMANSYYTSLLQASKPYPAQTHPELFGWLSRRKWPDVSDGKESAAAKAYIHAVVENQRRFWQSKGMKKLSTDPVIFTV